MDIDTAINSLAIEKRKTRVQVRQFNKLGAGKLRAGSYESQDELVESKKHKATWRGEGGKRRKLKADLSLRIITMESLILAQDER
jgi:hypothetical protein